MPTATFKCSDCGQGCRHTFKAQPPKHVQAGLCHACNFWEEVLVEYGNTTGNVLFDGKTVRHFNPPRLATTNGINPLGHGGAWFIAYDPSVGKFKISNDVWSRGIVPDNFLERFEAVRPKSHGVWTDSSIAGILTSFFFAEKRFGGDDWKNFTLSEIDSIMVLSSQKQPRADSLFFPYQPKDILASWKNFKVKHELV